MTASRLPSSRRPLRRVSVVGTTGSGKTFFARSLANVLGCPHIELDGLHWEPGWIEIPDEQMRERVRLACGHPTWVVDGNYACVRRWIWKQADTVIWLDYALPIVLWRAIRRAVWRVWSRESCCNGNRETIRQLFSPNSVVLWALTSHTARRRKYPGLLREFAAGGGQVIRFGSPREATRWLRELSTESQR